MVVGREEDRKGEEGMIVHLSNRLSWLLLQPLFTDPLPTHSPIYRLGELLLCGQSGHYRLHTSDKHSHSNSDTVLAAWCQMEEGEGEDQGESSRYL